MRPLLPSTKNSSNGVNGLLLSSTEADNLELHGPIPKNGKTPASGYIRERRGNENLRLSHGSENVVLHNSRNGVPKDSATPSRSNDTTLVPTSTRKSPGKSKNVAPTARPKNDKAKSTINGNNTSISTKWSR